MKQEEEPSAKRDKQKNIVDKILKAVKRSLNIIEDLHQFEKVAVKNIIINMKEIYEIEEQQEIKYDVADDDENSIDSCPYDEANIDICLNVTRIKNATISLKRKKEDKKTDQENDTQRQQQHSSLEIKSPNYKIYQGDFSIIDDDDDDRGGESTKSKISEMLCKKRKHHLSRYEQLYSITQKKENPSIINTSIKNNNTERKKRKWKRMKSSSFVRPSITSKIEKNHRLILNKNKRHWSSTGDLDINQIEKK